MTPFRFDDIMINQSFDPPYRFIVGRKMKWDATVNNILHVVDDAAKAFVVFNLVKSAEKNTPQGIVFDFFLHDSFGKDAIDYCKKKAVYLFYC